MPSCALSSRRQVLRRPKVCFTPPNPGRCEDPIIPPEPPVCPPPSIAGQIYATWWTFPKPGPRQHFYEAEYVALPDAPELVYLDDSTGVPGHKIFVALSDILPAVHVQIWMWDVDGFPSYANSAWHDIVWCEHQEIVVLNWLVKTPANLELTVTTEW